MIVPSELIIGLILIIISGLAFITYNHPDIARKIIDKLFIASIIIYFIIGAYSLGGKSAISNINQNITNLRDSTYKTSDNINDIKSLDSLSKINKEINNVFQDLIKNTNSIRDKNSDFSDNVLLYYIFTLLTLAVFFVLTYVFDKLRKK